MILNQKNKIITTFLMVIISISKINAQNQNLEKEQLTKFEYILLEKRKINTTIHLDDSYKIQIFNGSNEEAKKKLAQFRFEFKNIDATIVFNTPNYKVWVGSFKNRIEAERNIIDIRKKFPNLLLIKPGK